MGRRLCLRLRELEELSLPAVRAAGHARTRSADGEAGVLITRYLEHSLPYSELFAKPQLARYREHLLDAMAGLLVQLHLSYVFWGDCSLANTLFRRDAGALQAYLVDAETVEARPSLSPQMREHDLEIMAENVAAGLSDLAAAGALAADFPALETAASVGERYGRLWDEVTRETIVDPGEPYPIQERIRALNDLGFSVEEVELNATDRGDRLRLRAFVTDRNFHSQRLHSLTGLHAEERQARQLVNEIHELRATLSRERGRHLPLNVAAHRWRTSLYLPLTSRLAEPTSPRTAGARASTCR